MKQLLDFLPLVVFFVFYKLYNIFVASGALIAATAIALVVSWVVYRKLEKMTIITFILVETPLIQSMLGKELVLPSAVWRRLNIAWALFFFICGLINIYVAFWLPESLWVNFKVFGLTALTLLFTLFSGLYIWRHLPREEK